MHRARAMMQRTEKGRAYGAISAKAFAIFRALLFDFHNVKNGWTFPSYKRIAEAAHCAGSTVAEAIKALEAAGLMTWDNRVKRVRERCADLLGPNGWRWRVVRTGPESSFRLFSSGEKMILGDLEDKRIGADPKGHSGRGTLRTERNRKQ